MEGPDAGGGRAIMARATIRLRCRCHEQAQVLWDSVRADDPGTVDGRIEDDVLVITAGPDPMPSLRATLDDVLACLQAASGTTDVTTEIVEVD